MPFQLHEPVEPVTTPQFPGTADDLPDSAVPYTDPREARPGFLVPGSEA